MRTKGLSRYLASLLLIFVLILAACGGEAEVEAPAAEAPAAEVVEAPAEEEAGAEAVEEEATEEEATEEEPAAEVDEEAAAELAEAEEPAEDVAEETATETEGVDVVAVVDEYLSTIPEGFMALSLDALKQQMEVTDVYLVDVREPGEYEEGHIAGAVNIPIRSLAENLSQIPSDVPVVVYCASGHRAGMATTALRTLGYENVRAFPGGWKAWSAAGEPVSTEATEPGAFETPEIDAALLDAVNGFLTAIPEGYYAVGSVEKLNEMMEVSDVFLLDVRTQAEVDEEGMIPGATHIDLRELAQNREQIPTDQPVVTYCKSGFRAALAAAALHEMGFANVRAFPPSFAGWLEAGEEVTQ